jgi:hypothetical protein
VVQHHRFEGVHSRKNWIIRNQSSYSRVDCGRRLQRVRGPQAMRGADPGCCIGDGEIRSYPLKIGIRAQQSVKLIDSLLLGIPIRLNKQFCHGDCGSYGCVVSLFQPCEDVIGETYIMWIGFQLVYEDARIQRDAAMML